MISLHLFGDYWNRQPLAYDPIRRRLADRLAFTEDPADAQIALFTHTRDLTTHGERLARLLARNPRLRAVLLSEEPFWDTCWAPDPFTRYQTWREGRTAFGYGVLNHSTSDIFDTEALPYFLLTDPRYIAQCRPLLDRNAGFTAADWLARWKLPDWDVAFMAEKRDGSRHEPAFATHKVWGLSVLRTRIARQCRGDDILRSGRGWDEAASGRVDLADWHADKLDRLDLKCRYVSGIENTHMANYVTEKIFDAFAVGGVPLYIAHGAHDVFRYIGKDGWLNLESHLPLRDTARPGPFDARAPVSASLANAYVAVQNRLADLFSNRDLVETELDRLADRLFTALRRMSL